MTISAQKFHEAVEYNTTQYDTGVLLTKHITALVVLYQQQHGLTVDGKAGPNTIGSIERWIDENVGGEHMPPPSPIPGIDFYDRRKYAAQAHGPHKEWPVTIRPLEQVTGVCLHQTACILGERVERYDTVGAHYAITRAGKLIWLHDFTHKVAAANGWNNGTVSIEVDGLLAGVKGDPNTVWDDPSTPHKEQAVNLTPAQANTLRALLRYLKLESPIGPRMNVIVAHRQSSGDRQNDPGSEIWTIAIEMNRELGTSDGGAGFKLDDGRPIPQEWDPSRHGYKY